MSELDVEAQITKGSIVKQSEDGRWARVTSVKGVWGYWENGKRTEPFESRNAAAQAFLSEVAAGAGLDAPDSVREGLARLINPEVWKHVEPHSRVWYDDEDAQATYERFFWEGVEERRAPSLEAADRVLSHFRRSEVREPSEDERLVRLVLANHRNPDAIRAFNRILRPSEKPEPSDDLCDWCDMSARGNALQPEHDGPRRSCGEKYHGDSFEPDAEAVDEECTHETFGSRYIGRGVYRHSCHDCGEINNVDAQEWGE